ncbi:tetratricopeptide repeat protein [Ferrimonas balearica]|uniref:tetratricopeptide repeat protein n=1 Tax=Ferrimonas balearica TaxID=44012 RepID=UPI001C98FB3C|nr:tetratricopeptide repeat protein [Ferrimonas balearica]MBY5923005.1 tetratricopeptide repeat protein [Ferrimonas balearica]MBY5997618.1 tetratricopeptide repeat protein [Ferrimonas balearica]
MNLRSVILIFLLVGCASGSNTIEAPAEHLFADQHFDASSAAPAVEAIFALSPEMVSTVNALSRAPDTRRALVALIREDGGIRYDNRQTQTAAETFAQRSGNCMSLVVMTTALADALQMPVRFQLVNAPPVWDRQGGLYLINGHVNVKLSAPYRPDELRISDGGVTIDFLPGNQLRGYEVIPLSREELIARYYNNLAAEAMVDGDLDRAYYLLKAALEQVPGHGDVWNTLGVLYRKAGLEAKAEAVYRYAASQPDSQLDALHNLSILLASQDRLLEWQQVHAQLELKRIRNPYYHFDMGEIAYRAGEYDKAVRFYRKAVDLAEYRHEFHFGLSRAYFQLGDLQLSARHLHRAEDLAPRDEQARYQMKLLALQGGRP